MTSDNWVRSQSGFWATTLRTTPGPEIPMFREKSGSPTPWWAPAMKGLSSGTLAKTASLAQPMPFSERAARSLMIRPILTMAFMLIPARVEARLRNPQTRCVWERASGMASMRVSSAAVVPFWTMAPKPPRKSMLAFRAALSRARARRTALAVVRGRGSRSSDAGVTAIRRFVMGMPYWCSRRSAHRFSNRPLSTMRCCTRLLRPAGLRSIQSLRLMPSVTVRMSK